MDCFGTRTLFTLMPWIGLILSCKKKNLLETPTKNLTKVHKSKKALKHRTVGWANVPVCAYIYIYIHGSGLVIFCGKIRVYYIFIQLIPNMDPSVPRGSPWASSPRPRGRPSDLIWEVGETYTPEKLIWVFPKIGGKPPKWMVYNGTPY